MAYRESDLVLEVSRNVDPQIWDEGEYAAFLDLLFRGREYQKEATETVLRYMNSGEYTCLEDLARENFRRNEVIRERFNQNVDAFIRDLGLPKKLSATVDLATGTGKSYVMYALAAIMLAAKKVSRVLVLVPSITIESELTAKFRTLAENDQLNSCLGADYVAPAIINGDQSIVENSIIIENRDAIYKTQQNRNSIIDSLSGKGQETLVLNDEVHHVFYTDVNQWKYFIEDEGNHDIDFRYVIGFTGTAYKGKTTGGKANEYLSDVIYRYSLKTAIEEGFVKDVEYIDRGDVPADDNEKWQVVLKSHDKIGEELARFSQIKPITIFVSGEQRRADAQARAFKKFLMKSRKLSAEDADRLVLCVHSGAKAANDRLRLKSVDKPGNPVEFIFSVSMLTEGWDVKRVFQIVPDKERAFNSKLLIAQVLGRGLRRPDGWMSEWGIPKVVVFNHEKWAPKVRTLVDELLDFKKSVTVAVDPESQFHFELWNVEYKSEEISKVRTEQETPISFLSEGYVKLPTVSEEGRVEAELYDVRTDRVRSQTLSYSRDTETVRGVAEAMYNRFSDLPGDEKRDYYEALWPVEKLEKMIQLSLEKSSNTVITRKMKNIFLNSMNVLFRDYSKSVSYETTPDKYRVISTKELPKATTELSSLRKNRVLFYTEDFLDSDLDDATKASMEEVTDTTQGYFQQMVRNRYMFKTPQTAMITTGEPEKNFVRWLLKDEVARSIDAFVKSTDTGFYQLEYTWRKGTHQQNGMFNPDFFLKIGNLIVAVEIKEDAQIRNPDPENIGKYRAAEAHFKRINEYCKRTGNGMEYKQTFLTPKSYDDFFQKLLEDGADGIRGFNSYLDVTLSTK